MASVARRAWPGDELKFCICHAGMPICASKVNRHMPVGRVNLWADRCVILARRGAYQAASVAAGPFISRRNWRCTMQTNDFQEQVSFRNYE